MMAGTEIMTVADLNRMEARVDIGEIDVVLIAVGQKTRLEVEAFRDQKFSGVVSEIANAAKGPASNSQSSGGGSQQHRDGSISAGVATAMRFRSNPLCELLRRLVRVKPASGTLSGRSAGRRT